MLASLAGVCSTPAYVVPDQVAERLTGYHVHRGALAAMDRRPLPAVAQVLDRARNVVILEDIVDHTNVGAIFRSAAALGDGRGHPFAPVRRPALPPVRQGVDGCGIRHPLRADDDWYGGLAAVRAAGFRLLALTPDVSAVPISRVPPGEPAALMLGTEGDGLSVPLAARGGRGRLHPDGPGGPGPGVDSLNVVAAAAIACHHLATLGH